MSDKQWVVVRSELADLFWNALDNLSDMPISDAWAESWCKRAESITPGERYEPQGEAVEAAMAAAVTAAPDLADLRFKERIRPAMLAAICAALPELQAKIIDLEARLKRLDYRQSISNA